jgi:hypothetical protein
MTDRPGEYQVVDIKSAWASKINWAQMVAMGAMLLTMFGVNLPPEVQAHVVAGIVAAQAIVTWVIKTWFTKSITPASARKL